MNDIAELIRRLSGSIEELKQEVNKHSLAQELIDEGAYDVAIAYINFLKGKSARKEVKK